MTLAGERLCDGDCMAAGGEITFGNVRAPVVALSDTSAQVVVPDAAQIGKTSIVLTVNDTSSNALAFTVLAPGGERSRSPCTCAAATACS